MRKLVFFAATLSLAVVSCKKEDASSKIENSAATENAETKGFAVAKFDKTEHNFGDLKKGQKATTEFTITNTGTSDLVIVDAHASCGCTVPEYPKTPIKPGESAPIEVVFSANSVGMQNKTVTIKANTENTNELLTIKANVTE